MAAYGEEKSADRRHTGELIRGATLRLWNLQVKQQYRISDPARFWPMPWDEREEGLEAAARKIRSMAKKDRDLMAQQFIQKVDGKQSKHEGKPHRRHLPVQQGDEDGKGRPARLRKGKPKRPQ